MGFSRVWGPLCQGDVTVGVLQSRVDEEQILCPGELIREQDGCYPVRCGGHRRLAEVLGSGIVQVQAFQMLALFLPWETSLLSLCFFFFFPIFANDGKSGLEKNQPYWLDLETTKSILKIHYGL